MVKRHISAIIQWLAKSSVLASLKNSFQTCYCVALTNIYHNNTIRKYEWIPFRQKKIEQNTKFWISDLYSRNVKKRKTIWNLALFTKKYINVLKVCVYVCRAFCWEPFLGSSSRFRKNCEIKVVYWLLLGSFQQICTKVYSSSFLEYGTFSWNYNNN